MQVKEAKSAMAKKEDWEALGEGALWEQALEIEENRPPERERWPDVSLVSHHVLSKLTVIAEASWPCCKKIYS